jgi:hypothetical protein
LALAAHSALPLSRCAERLARKETRCRKLWALTPHGSQTGTVADVRAEEAKHLTPLSRMFDGEYAKRVSPTNLIHLERNRYSVPRPSPIARSVYEFIPKASLSPPMDKSSASIGASSPAPTTNEYDDRLRLAALSAVIQRKPGALRNRAPFVELLPAFRALQQRMLKTPGGDREMVEILALVLQHDKQAVLIAVELTLEAGAPGP